MFRPQRGGTRFPFAELCEKPPGASDYLAIAKTCHTVVLSYVPILTAQRRNAARRIVTLIDALYECKVNLVASAAAEPDDLCIDRYGVPAFVRTASRLIEMQSADYIREMHSA